jgi:hypothetical protein
MDRNNLQKLHHVGNSASVPSTQQSLPSTRGNSRAVVTPAGASRRPEEKFAKEGAIEPLNSTDGAWPPFVHAPSGTALIVLEKHDGVFVFAISTNVNILGMMEDCICCGA